MARPSKAPKAEFGPAFDDAAMMRIEKVASSIGIGQTRRLALAICARGSDSSQALVDLGGESYARVLKSVEGFEQHLADIHRLAEAAVARLKMVCPSLTNRGAGKGTSHG